MDNFQNGLELLANLLQIKSYEILVNDFNNNDLMQYLKHQDDLLEEIIKQNFKLLQLLKGGKKMNAEETEKIDDEKLKCLIEKEIDQIINSELNEHNLEILNTLVDIKKDLENIDYWDVKKEVMKMRYEDYDGYAEERYGNYGRRGVPGTGRGRYRGHHDEGESMIEDMKDSYRAYSESREAYSRGNYNAGQDSMRALEDTMRLFTEFTQKMVDEIDGPEAKQIVRKYLHKISQMGDM